MNIAIIGTGSVGQAIAGKLSSLGHAVKVGTRDIAATLAKTAPDAMGAPAYAMWAKGHPKVSLGTFAEAAKFGELVINAASGMGSIAALQSCGSANLAGKILIDISNPLDFSQGMPPFLSIVNTDSLGEQIQKAFPQVKVVKTLNVVSAPVMIDPSCVPGGQPSMFVSGNDATAKTAVSKFLKDWFGWADVMDRGDITTARGSEMVLALWVRTWGVVQTPIFGFKVVR